MKEHERQRVDAEFVRVAHDADYHHALVSLEKDLAPASGLAWAWSVNAPRRCRLSLHPSLTA